MIYFHSNCYSLATSVTYCFNSLTWLLNSLKFSKFHSRSIRVSFCSKDMTIFSRFINIIMIIFFALATFVQHNDPDWYFWGSVYLVPTLMSTVQAFSVTITCHYVYQAFIRSCALLYSLLTLVHAYYFIRFANVSTQKDATYESQSMPSPSPSTSLLIVDSEEGREFLGSLIALLWIFISIYITTTNQVGDAALSRRFKILIFIFTLTPIILWFILYTFQVYLC